MREVPDPHSEENIKALGLSDESADRLRARRKSDELRLFFVNNTANNRQFMLASSAKFARILSCSTGHLHAPENGKVFVPTEKFIASNPGFWSAVQRAIRDRTPGEIVMRGNHAIMGAKVYAPLHEV